MADLDLNLSETLDQKILGFKSDPEKMKEIHEFLNELFEKACIEAENRQGVGGGTERKTKFVSITAKSQLCYNDWYYTWIDVYNWNDGMMLFCFLL